MSVIVISVGGSLIVPDKINTSWIRKFASLVRKQVRKGNKIILVTGGGRTARLYQNAARKTGNLVRDDLDWLGIHSTRLNAHLFRAIFRDIAHPNIIKDPTKAIPWKKKVLIAAGWKPGWSTDYISALLAKKFGAKEVLNLSNIDYVYDKDPKLKGAKKLPLMSWKEFRKMVGNTWDPGLHSPFDPVASRIAQKAKLKVVIMDGTDLPNVEKYLVGQKFKGTKIEK